MTSVIPVCIYCKHFNGELWCAAFPNGIPKRILDGGDKHLVSTGSDNGIVFEARSGVDRSAIIEVEKER